MKSDIAEIIKFIETSYNVEQIKYKDVFLWPYLRIIVFSQYEIKDATIGEKKKQTNFWSKLLMLFSLFVRFLLSVITTDFFLFLKKKATVLFTDSGEARFVDGKKISKVENELINIKKNIVPFYQVKKGTKKAFKHYINRDFTDILIRLKCRFIYIDITLLKGIDILDEICKKLDIRINTLKILQIIIASYNYYFTLFGKMRPNTIVVNCYYDLVKMSMISAAKKLRIPVIEMQHGMIGHSHLAYICFKKIEENPYANFLFSFGNRFKHFVSDGIYEPEKIKIVGSNYLDIIRQNLEINKQLFEKKYNNKTKGKIVITVASQWTIDKQLLSFYEEFAKRNENFFIIVKVRPFEEYHRKYLNLLPNFTIETELDTYICMQNSNITSTVYSTCAVESLALGVPIILVDIDKLATSSMKPFFGQELKSVEYVRELVDMYKAIDNLIKLSKSEILMEGDLFFHYGHKQLLQKALKEVEMEYQN